MNKGADVDVIADPKTGNYPLHYAFATDNIEFIM